MSRSRPFGFSIKRQSLAAVGRGLVVTFLLLGLSILLVIPERLDFSHSFLENPGDPSLYVATWRWQWRALTQGYIHQFWQGWFFYPKRWVMGYTEHILGLMPLFKVFEWMFSSAIAAFTAVAVSLFIFDGWAGYMLGKRIGRSYGAGVVGAVAMSFSAFHFNQIGHMHVSSYFTVPLILLLLEDLLGKPSMARAMRLGVLWGATPLFSYSSWAIASVAIPFFALAWLGVNGEFRRKDLFESSDSSVDDASSVGRIQKSSRGTCDTEGASSARRIVTGKLVMYLGGSALVMLVIAAPLSLQLIKARSEVNVTRSPVEIAIYSVKLSNLFQPSERSIAYKHLPAPVGKNDKMETIAYIGVSGVVLLLIGYFCPLGRLTLVRLSQRRQKRNGERANTRSFSNRSDTRPEMDDFLDAKLVKRLTPWLVTAIVGIFFMLGPEMRVRRSWAGVPGPYRLLTVVPGLSHFRAAGRFSLLVYIFVAVCAASAWARLARRSWVGSLFVMGVCGLWVFESAIAVGQSAPLPANIREAPVYVRWLAQAERGPSVELPIYAPGVRSSAEAEAVRVYLSTYDWQPRVNGYSGYEPVGYLDTVSDLTTFPAQKAMDRLESLRVRYIVVDFPALARYRKGGPDAAHYGWEYPDLNSLEIEIRKEIASTPKLVLRADFEDVAIYELTGR